MSQPPRLRHVGSDFERDRLTSALDDVGSEQGLQRVLMAIGIATTTISALPPTDERADADGTAGGASASSVAVASETARLVARITVPWVGIGVTLLVVGAMVFAASRLEALAGRPSAHPGHGELPPALSSPASEALIDTRLVPFADPGLASPRADHAAFLAPPSASRSPLVPQPVPPDHALRAFPAAKSLPPAPSAASSLDAELAVLDRARASLALGHASSAMMALDAHDRDFPGSALSDEASVLRVDALAAQGHRAAAMEGARRFLAANPTSPHAAHLLQVLRDEDHP